MREEAAVELRFSELTASTRGVVGVAPEDSVERAATLMAMHEFSQLPVLSGPRSLKGVVSWKSLGEARLRTRPAQVRECMLTPNVVMLESPVLAALDSISTHDFVLVEERDGTVAGIVTAADITVEFGWLAKPFLVLSEVERRLRQLLARGGKSSELLVELFPDVSRSPSSFEEWTLGELERAFQCPELWKRLRIDLDRREFVKSLSRVRELRNELVHFRASRVDPAGLQVLESFARVLRLLG